jgi:hypothetical protein
MAAGWEAAGLLLGLASAAALLGAGTAGRRLALAGVGIWGVVMFLPTTVVHFFAGTVGVPLLILLAGVVLLTITLVPLRVRLPGHRQRRPRRPRSAQRSDPTGRTPPLGPLRPDPAQAAMPQPER